MGNDKGSNSPKPGDNDYFGPGDFYDEPDEENEVYSTASKVRAQKATPPATPTPTQTVELSDEEGYYAKIIDDDKPLPPPLPERAYVWKTLNKQLGADIFTRAPKDMTAEDIKAVYPKLLHDEVLSGTFYTMLPDAQKRMYDKVETEQQKRYTIEHVKLNLLTAQRAISKELQTQLESIPANTPVTPKSFEVQSLLNADPLENAKKGRTTLSLRSVEESLNGYISPELQKLVQQNRQSLEEQLSTMNGINSLLRENDKFRTVQNLGFFGCSMQEKETFINNVLKSIEDLPESANTFLQDKTFQPRFTASLQPIVSKIFGPDIFPKNISADMIPLTVDPTKLINKSKQQEFAQEASKYIKAFVALEPLINQSTLNLSTEQKSKISPTILPSFVEIKTDSPAFAEVATRHIHAFVLIQSAIQNSGLNSDQADKITNALLKPLADLDLTKLEPKQITQLTEYTVEKLKNHVTLVSTLRAHNQKISSNEFGDIIDKITQKYKELQTPIIDQIIKASGLKLSSNQKLKITDGIPDTSKLHEAQLKQFIDSAAEILKKNVTSDSKIIGKLTGKDKIYSKALSDIQDIYNTLLPQSNTQKKLVEEVEAWNKDLELNKALDVIRIAEKTNPHKLEQTKITTLEQLLRKGNKPIPKVIPPLGPPPAAKPDEIKSVIATTSVEKLPGIYQESTPDQKKIIAAALTSKQYEELKKLPRSNNDDLSKLLDAAKPYHAKQLPPVAPKPKKQEPDYTSAMNALEDLDKFLATQEKKKRPPPVAPQPDKKDLAKAKSALQEAIVLTKDDKSITVAKVTAELIANGKDTATSKPRPPVQPKPQSLRLG